MSLKEELSAGRRFSVDNHGMSSTSPTEVADAILHAEILPIFSTLYDQWKRNRLFIRYLLVDVNFSKEADYTIRVTPWLKSTGMQDKKVVSYPNTGLDKRELWREVERIAKDEWQLETGVFHGIGQYFLLPLC